MSDLENINIMWAGSIIQKLSVAIFGWMLVNMVLVRLRKWSILATEQFGFEPGTTGILAEQQFIIDRFHTSEHVWDCGKKLFGEGTEVTEK